MSSVVLPLNPAPPAGHPPHPAPPPVKGGISGHFRFKGIAAPGVATRRHSNPVPDDVRNNATSQDEETDFSDGAPGRASEATRTDSASSSYSDKRMSAATDAGLGLGMRNEATDKRTSIGTHIRNSAASHGGESGKPPTRSSAQKLTSSRTMQDIRAAVDHAYNDTRASTLNGLHHLHAVRRKKRDFSIRNISKTTVDNKLFVFLTTVFTFYALIGDDLKLITTNKPADIYFDVLTVVCMFLFTAEIVMSCFGKSDYFLGFFFTLDVISTVTLLLDISYVSDVVMGDGEDLDKLRSGRTARVGARAGRVVRVIRLVRILKLYKAIHEARQAQAAKRARELRAANGEADEDDGWMDQDEDAGEQRKKLQAAGESRVGKKLSEMTTRRVILLVLTMLLVMPFLQTTNSMYPPVSAFYGADNVHELFMTWNATPTARNQELYEKAILKYVYYHNWYSGNLPDQFHGSGDAGPATFQQQVFWVGIMSLDPGRKGFIESDSVWNATALRTSTIESYSLNQTTQVSQNEIYPSGTMPSFAQKLMSQKWTSNCHIDKEAAFLKSKKQIWRKGFSILSQEVEGQVDYAVPCPENLRNFEKAKYYPRITTLDAYEQWHFAFYFDTRPLQRQEATFSLMITSFICVVLCVASLFFSNDANRLVLRPVEKMIKRVEIIREQPMIAVKMADEEFKLEEMEKIKRRRMKSQLSRSHRRNSQIFVDSLCSLASCRCLGRCSDDTVTAQPMETVILEKTIIKLGSLLALGFGEAGANIIGHNLESSDSAGVNGMVPGSRVEAIIGVARIRDFSIATEVLKSKVMTFVNQIAEIVHGVVSEFHGAANKNNGDQFLLVWRISGLEDEMVSRMADFSTIAFAKILGAVHRSPTLALYRGHPALQQRLGSNYRVHLSFGLHCGWAIEGAVGSEFKIDASYLSPNVSIAVNIEDATSIYGVSILLTESVVEICSKDIAVKFRKIDRVIISGSSRPLDVYCLDLDYTRLIIDNNCEGRPAVWNQRLRFKARQFLESEKQKKLEFHTDTITWFDNYMEIARMRSRYSMQFTQLFNMGYANYFEGEWEVARKLLNETRHMLRAEDGPSAALLKFMEFGSYKEGQEDGDTRFLAPPDWAGVHDFHEKAHHYRKSSIEISASEASARKDKSRKADPVFPHDQVVYETHQHGAGYVLPSSVSFDAHATHVFPMPRPQSADSETFTEDGAFPSEGLLGGFDPFDISETVA